MIFCEARAAASAARAAELGKRGRLNPHRVPLELAGDERLERAVHEHVGIATNRGGEVAVGRGPERIVPLVDGKVDGAPLGTQEQGAREVGPLGATRARKHVLNRKGVTREQARCGVALKQSQLA